MSKSSKSAKDFASQLASGNHTVNEYAIQQASASKAITTVGTSSKLAAVGVKALNVAMNVGIWLVITEAINLAYKAIDNWVNRIKNQEQALSDATQAYTDAKQKVTDTNTQLDDTNKKIAELQAKGTLTFVEQSQLNTLIQTRSELEKQLETYKLLEEEKNKGQTDTAVKTLQSYSGRKRNLNTGEEDPAWLSLFTTDNEKESNQIDNFIHKYQQLSSLGNKATSDQQVQLTSLKKNLVDIANEYGSTANKISDNSDSVSLKAKTDALAIRNSILKVVDAANYETTAFNNVYKNANFTNVVSQLNSLAQQGKLTTQTFNQSSYKNIAKAFSDAGISAKDAATQINALNKSTSNNNSAAKQAATSNSDLAKSLKDLMSSNVKNYQALETILGDVKNYKTLSSDNLNSLLKMFPDMSSAVLEYNAGLKSTASMVDLIKSKMKSLQSSYQQELQQELANNADFYNDTIGKHTDLTNQLSSLYGIDYKNYSTYDQLKEAIDNAILQDRIGNENITGQQLAQQYFANVQTYSQYETAKQNVTAQILASIQNANSAQIAKLAAVYGIDVKNFGDTQSGKVQIAGQIATKIAEVYGAVNEGFSSSVSDQLKNLQEEKAALQAGTLPGSSAWSSSQRSSALSEVNKEISTYQNLIKGMSGDTTDLIKKIDAITNIKPIIPSTSNALKSAAKKAEEAAKKANKDREEAAKNAAEALKKQYEAELKIIEANKEMDKYKPDKYGVEGLQYYNALLALYNKWKNSALDSDDKLELQEKVLSAHKSYEQNILDVSYKELDNRIKLGKTEENSINHLNNLLQIQKLLNSANMSLVNTQENQLELQQKIYDVRKQYAQDIIDKSYKQQQHRESLGIDYNSSLSNDINGDRGILQNLLDIQKLLLNGGTAQPANTEENRWELEEKIYDQKKKILEDDISDLDTQVQLGNIQENSLGYLSKLYSLKQEIIKSDLNAIDKENELNSIEEKILDARKGYIQQLQSDLSDESIVGSYGYRIKQIQDQIDAINNQADAESKELAVEKAKAAWEEAQNQKSISVFRSGKGFVYEADQSAITEKKQAYADAEREEQIEKLTEQKNQIQKDEDAVKTQLDNALSILQGTNNQAWSNILSQIEGVLGRSVSDITSASEQNIDSWDDQNDVLNNTTENTKRNYQQQINVLNKYLTQLTTVQGEISNQNQSIANSFTKMADAIYYVNNEYDRLIRLMSDAETVRETENERYNDYNQGARSNHQTVRYASGTDYASGGLSVVGEDGKETILEPLSSGQYTMLETGSKVFTADMTKNLQKWSQFNPQNMVLKAQLGNSRVRNDITNNKITEQPVVEINGDLSFPEIHSGDQAQYLINRLCTIGAKARTKVK